MRVEIAGTQMKGREEGEGKKKGDGDQIPCSPIQSLQMNEEGEEVMTGEGDTRRRAGRLHGRLSTSLLCGH
jgi:hypothetical protein